MVIHHMLRLTRDIWGVITTSKWAIPPTINTCCSNKFHNHKFFKVYMAIIQVTKMYQEFLSNPSHLVQVWEDCTFFCYESFDQVGRQSLSIHLKFFTTGGTSKLQSIDQSPHVWSINQLILQDYRLVLL
jgi:hypothetical protein